MRRWLLLTLALGVAGSGCNLILGNEEHTYEADASTDSSTADDQTLVDVGSDTAELTDGGMKAMRDGETGGRDADASDGEGSKADASDGGPHVPTCTGAGFCTPGACRLGVNVCDGGALECAVTGNASNGATCDAGAVCSGGACEACNGGVDCTEAGSCQKMTVACNGGSAVCTAAGLVTDGTQCGSNLYCNAGACKACTNGASCAPTGKPCDQGVVSCSQGQVVCTDKGTFAQSGTSCGTNMVCNASGACVACAANVQCTPSANPCHLGLTSCASGTSVCMDTGNPQTDGTGCTGTNACNRTYTCQSGTCTGSSPVVCTASDQCHTAGTCNTTTGACSNPVATSASCNDGNACTTGDTCQSNGTCSGTAVACNSPPACHSAGTCSGGTCSYPVATGASCGTNEVCNSSGTCGCASGYNSCGGQCVTYTTAANCGSCGHSCGGGTCASGNTCTRWTVGSGFTNTPVQIASDGTHVFWADTGTNAVYQVPLAGGSATTLAMDSSFSTIITSPYVWAMSTEGGRVAWVTSTALWTSPVGGPGMKQVFTFPPSVSTLATIALNAGGTRAAVMATTTTEGTTGALSELYDCPIGGTSCTDVGSLPFVPTGNPANATTYFFEDLTAETIEGFTFGTTTVSNLVSSASATQSGVAIDASHIYWLSNNGFVSAPLGGGSATLIATLPPNLVGAVGFASDSRNVYATVNEYSSSGSAAYVMYAPLTNGGAAPLALYAENVAGAVVAAGGFVFWIDGAAIYGIAAP